MNEYKFIINPETGRRVNIYGKKGTQILNRYITTLQGGYMMEENVDFNNSISDHLDDAMFMLSYCREKPDKCDLDWGFEKTNKRKNTNKIQKIYTPQKNSPIKNTKSEKTPREISPNKNTKLDENAAGKSDKKGRMGEIEQNRFKNMVEFWEGKTK